MIHYEIESLYFGGDWENDFRIDDQPAKFATYEEAKAFLDDHLDEQLDAYNRGDLEDIGDDFRIVKVTKEVL